MTNFVFIDGKRVQVGTIIKAFNKKIKQPYQKYHLCVCVSNGLFFFINTDSRDRYPPSLEIKQPVYTFLNHDSYISCNETTNLSDIKEENLQVVGRLKKKQAEELMDLIKREGVFSKIKEDKILQSLEEYIKNG